MALGHSPGFGVAFETAAQLVQIQTLLSLSSFVVRIVFLLLLLVLLPPLLLAIRTCR